MLIIDRDSMSCTGFIQYEDVPANERSFAGPLAIYALVDPRDSTVRYVGVTRQRLDQRLAEHLENPTNARTRAWLRELFAAGCSPEIEQLQRVAVGWQVAEMEWIAWFRVRGDLLNVDVGGVLYESGSGWDEVKAQKARAIYASALSCREEDRPPPCARDTRSEGERRMSCRRLRKAMARGERRAAERREKTRTFQREAAMAVARASTSIEPRIRKQGAPASREKIGADTPTSLQGARWEERENAGHAVT